MKNSTNHFKLIVLITIMFVIFASCGLDPDPTGVGIGNIMVFFFFSIILTLLVGGLGFLLGLIPVIGPFFKCLAVIAIVLWWVFLTIMCRVTQGVTPFLRCIKLI